MRGLSRMLDKSRFLLKSTFLYLLGLKRVLVIAKMFLYNLVLQPFYINFALLLQNEKIY